MIRVGLHLRPDLTSLMRSLAIVDCTPMPPVHSSLQCFAERETETVDNVGAPRFPLTNRVDLPTVAINEGSSTIGFR